MIYRILLNIILGSLLFILQFGLISALPGFWRNLNLIVVVLVFILVLKGFRIALWWLLGLAVLLDIYSFLPFGINILSYLWMIIFTNLVLVKLITNRSLYSFVVLIFFALVNLKFIAIIFIFAINFFTNSTGGQIFNLEILINLLFSLGTTILAAVIIYYLLNLVSRKLKPVFLVKS